MIRKTKGAHDPLSRSHFPEENASARAFLPLTERHHQEGTRGSSIRAWSSSPGRSFVLGGILLLQLTVASLLLLPLVLAPSPSRALVPRSPLSVGTVSFTNSGQLDPLSSQGQSDRLSASFHGLTPPGPGKSYTAWLLPDRTEQRIRPLRLDILDVVRNGQAQLTYQDPSHRNLLATFSGFRLTEQENKEQPLLLDQRTRCYEGWFSRVPTPGDEMGYSQLSHLRHLLAKDPTLIHLGLSGGLATWLVRNSEKLLEYSLSARDSWAGKQTNADAAGLMHRQFIRILQYLDGQAYAWLDLPSGTPWLISPQSGRIGLLESVSYQEPPGYLAHVRLHVMGFAGAPGATANQREQAGQIDLALSYVTKALNTVREVARQLITMTRAQLQQPEALSLLNRLVSETMLAINGEENGQGGATTGGIMRIQARLQQFATISVLPCT